MRTVVIMQPTYLPWCGYFDLMDQSDVFVFLDSVQFNHRSWQQRNRIKSSEGELMLTVPVLTKSRRDQTIAEVEIDSAQEFAGKHMKSIQRCYGKAPFYGDFSTELFEILEKKHKLLAELNIELIRWIKGKLGIKAELVKSSTLQVEGQREDLLLRICKALKAQRYLSAFGSKAYLEGNNQFRENEIELCYHHYEPTPYSQLYGSFLPSLAAVDLLFNEGEKSLSIIRAGRRESYHVA